MDGKHLDHNLGEASRSLAGEKHFAASERIDDGKHQPIAERLDHSPMGGISQRQSESMTGSIDLLSASRPLTGERHFQPLWGEASACRWQFEHVFLLFLLLFCVCVCVWVCAGDAERFV